MSVHKAIQLGYLEKIFDDGSHSPIFRHNNKYPTKGLPRIAYGDVMDRRIVIREDNSCELGPSFWDEKADVVVEYDSLEALVDDGWRLD